MAVFCSLFRHRLTFGGLAPTNTPCKTHLKYIGLNIHWDCIITVRVGGIANEVHGSKKKNRKQQQKTEALVASWVKSTMNERKKLTFLVRTRHSTLHFVHNSKQPIICTKTKQYTFFVVVYIRSNRDDDNRASKKRGQQKWWRERIVLKSNGRKMVLSYGNESRTKNFAWINAEVLVVKPISYMTKTKKKTEINALKLQYMNLARPSTS